jgi:hypothetical protein
VANSLTSTSARRARLRHRSTAYRRKQSMKTMYDSSIIYHFILQFQYYCPTKQFAIDLDTTYRTLIYISYDGTAGP